MRIGFLGSSSAQHQVCLDVFGRKGRATSFSRGRPNSMVLGKVSFGQKTTVLLAGVGKHPSEPAQKSPTPKGYFTGLERHRKAFFEKFFELSPIELFGGLVELFIRRKKEGKLGIVC